KLMPNDLTIKEAMTQDGEFKREVMKNQELMRLIEIAQRLEGLARHASLHAAGIVIAPQELTEYLPLYKSPDRGEVSSQYDMISIEQIGLLKMDILGLRTLTVIDETLKMTGIDKSKIDIDDPATYNLLQEGKTIGVFQLESRGMREILQNYKPEKFEHLIAIIAMYRPGPLGTMNINKLIENRRNPDRIEYLHPSLADILEETHGIILYQEQVMKIANVIAGFSMAEADTLRRAMGKKMSELMEGIKEKFINGARKRRIDPELAERIFEMIKPFAGYGFNKSHAAAYAKLAFETAYLKTHYPVEFMVNSLSSEINDTDRLGILIKEARRMGIEIAPPDINQSRYDFTIEDSPKRRIRYGLGALKNVGKPASLEIEKERVRGPYKSFYDFNARINHSSAGRIVNKKCIESLIKAGAFDTLSPNRAKLLNEIEAGEVKPEKQTDLFSTDEDREVKEFGWLERIALEKEVFGFYFSGHPLEQYEYEIKGLGIMRISDLLNHRGEIGAVVIGGIIVSVNVKRDRKNREYAIISVEDFDGAMEVIIFSDLFSRKTELIKKDKMVVIKGRIDGGMDERAILRAEQIIPFADAQKYLKQAVIKIDSKLLEERDFLNLQEILARNPGDTEVWLDMIDNKGVQRMIRSRAYKISPRREVIAAIKKI
ncbi:MAG: DNA polymerase III subunit alpha, partial [candidate division WOR-3 bacterium]